MIKKILNTWKAHRQKRQAKLKQRREEISKKYAEAKNVLENAFVSPCANMTLDKIFQVSQLIKKMYSLGLKHEAKEAESLVETARAKYLRNTLRLYHDKVDKLRTFPIEKPGARW